MRVTHQMMTPKMNANIPPIIPPLLPFADVFVTPPNMAMVIPNMGAVIPRNIPRTDSTFLVFDTVREVFLIRAMKKTIKPNKSNIPPATMSPKTLPVLATWIIRSLFDEISAE